MTNEQKAQRLEELADVCAGADAALLREAAQALREREAVRWEKLRGKNVEWRALYRGFNLVVYDFSSEAVWYALGAHEIKRAGGESDSLAAAQAAAIAWVDGVEGK